MKNIIAVILFVSISVFAQEMKHDMKDHKMEKDSIVREGEIDLKAIDENKDGKVFQDQMCWNVVSDSAGRCPLCEMKLKEVSLEQAKANLLKNGFKVKDHQMKGEMKKMDNKKDEMKMNKEKTAAVEIWNKNCPVMGEEVDPAVPTVQYKGKTIGFCCPGCDEKFFKDSEQFMTRLNEKGKLKEKIGL
ncbi:MAG: heavy metal-binding domain-containing protein [Ignavibacteria bacterium]|jgi:YHS domain-containing protein